MTQIYLVENIEPGTNKVYIGKTTDSRKSAHKSTYGSQISYTYIDEISSINHDDWEPIETYWIEQFRQWGFEVVNKRKQGGSGPDFHTEETKTNMSKPKSTTEKMRKPKSEEHKANMRKPKSEEHIAAMVAGRTGVKHKLHKPMPEWYGKFISNINKGRVSPNKGKTKSEEAKYAISEKLKGRISPNTKPVIQYNKENKVIYEWISISEAGRELGISLSNITSVCKNYSKTAGGYIWKYK